MQRSSVVLPRAGGAEQGGDAAARQRRGRRRARSPDRPDWKRASMLIAARRPVGFEGIERQQHQEGEDHHAAGQPVGLGVFHAPRHGRRSAPRPPGSAPGMLPPIISTTPNSPTVWAKPRMAAVRKPGRASGTATREEGIQRRGAQGRGDFQRPLADGLEGVLERLHDEGHRVEHRGDHQAPEGEGQQADAGPLGELPDRAVRPHQHQQIEAEHRRRQHQRQRHHRADRALPPERVRASHQAIGVPISSRAGW